MHQYTLMIDWKPGDHVWHKMFHIRGVVSEAVVTRRIGMVKDSEDVYYIVDFQELGLTRCPVGTLADFTPRLMAAAEEGEG